MRPYNSKSFKFNSVKDEVSEAIQFDWKRDKVDDAKKRAIYDSKSYDDFTARVKGCTLKPIHKNEFNAPPKFSFNRQRGGSDDVPPLTRIVGCDLSTTTARSVTERRLAERTAAGANTIKQTGSTLPRNSRELDREFRRQSTAQDKVALLEALDGDACARLFAKELDAELLRQMLVALEEAAPRGPARRFLRDLAVRCPTQVLMASTFLTVAERGVVPRLLARDPAEHPGEDVRICAALSVPVAAVAAAASSLPAQPEDTPPVATGAAPSAAEAFSCDALD